jgi:hypothetical protein
MLSENELKELGVQPWAAISNDFTAADLLLGNGFSMSFTPGFRYDSLFDLFLHDCEAHEQALFRAFGTSNFEAILADLASARRVNGILNLPTDPIDATSARLRNGLVKAVQGKHPKFASLDYGRLTTASQQLDAFSDVYTLNYDCLLYHILMITKDRHTADWRVRPFNDYFWNRVGPDYLQFMDFQNYKKYKHVYYLHGALFVFRTDQGDVKLSAGGGVELINAIAGEILGGTIPLFISEGTAREKESAIARSDYLHFANAKLKSTRESLVVYGASLADPDAHVAAAIKRGTQRVAVSIHPVNKSATDIEAETHAFRARLAGCDLRFFDARTLFT